MRKLFLLAGEISGDTHGSGLMRSLLELAGGEEVRFYGYGGPLMKEVGGEAMLDWVEDAGVVGLWEVLKVYGWFKQKMADALAIVASEKPDAVILVDYPGFNLRLAKSLREAGYDRPIIYYISPQVWAWKKGRVKTMAQLLDLMICIFPFEKELYEKSGLKTEFAGHPMVDRVKSLTKNISRQPDLVGFFPGSRANEVRRLFPTLIETARLLQSKRPGARFVVSAANARLAGLMEELADAAGFPEAKGWIEIGTVYDLMQQVQVGVVASGTATLESACFGMPYILVYQVNPLTYVVGRAVMRIKFLGIVNILAGRQVVQEMVQGDFRPEPLASGVLELMDEGAARSRLLQDLRETVDRLGEGGAYQRAAKAVWEQVAHAKVEA
ncbi:lipid-A-disaccharide synthase [Verrucomicrobium sp. BvORR106]|uniref:lipid-A-disaccharide synthase n=1 Tax=Verrucomicrobium sp. BvORR106 TaxID=1403819 RepID=UPI0005700677|nr:lipid-A-disaccharide synthase [Verrucomicrobium sp. BvORR106]